MGLNVHNNLLRLIRDGGKCVCVCVCGGYLCPTTYSLHCLNTRMTLHEGGQLCVRYFNVSLIVRAKSQDCVHCG